ncbi:MAG: serine protease, partial [Bacteroidota bacterium]|nr:serine protease [Bacteroidota bacterium]
MDASGTGFVIGDQRILTNAHVVEYNTYIAVKISGDAKRYEARAAFVSHQADLAMLEVLDSEFFEGVPALEIGPSPTLRDEVTVVGFPTGGEEQSHSSGIVSRI